MLNLSIIQIAKILLFYFIASNNLFAQEILLPKHHLKEVIKISADNMSIYYKKGEALFEGNVITIQGSLKINAEKMYISFINDSKKNWKINNIRYNKKVIITSSIIFKGDSAYLDFAKKILILEGNIIIYKDKSEITGNRLIYDLSKGSMQLYGNNINNRAKAVINIE